LAAPIAGQMGLVATQNKIPGVWPENKAKKTLNLAVCFHTLSASQISGPIVIIIEKKTDSKAD